MILGRVVGNAVSTVKHESLAGQRLLTVQPIQAASMDPVLALDVFGAGVGSLVVLTNDGRWARELVADETSPARWSVLGIVDETNREPD